MDMMFATCDQVSSSTGVGSDCYLNVLYNRQLPVCASPTTPSIINGQRVCRPLDDLCLRDPGFRFDKSSRSSNDVGRFECLS
jgi:integrin alpha FG-GAP repeat containing protein 1